MTALFFLRGEFCESSDPQDPTGSLNLVSITPTILSVSGKKGLTISGRRYGHLCLVGFLRILNLSLFVKASSPSPSFVNLIDREVTNPSHSSYPDPNTRVWPRSPLSMVGGHWPRTLHWNDGNYSNIPILLGKHNSRDGLVESRSAGTKRSLTDGRTDGLKFKYYKNHLWDVRNSLMYHSLSWV